MKLTDEQNDFCNINTSKKIHKNAKNNYTSYRARPSQYDK